MDRVLIDSDVILDSFFDRKPFVEYSSAILGLCESGKIKGYLTPLIIVIFITFFVKLQNMKR